MKDIKEQVAIDLTKIQDLISKQVADHIAQLEKRFNESSSFLEFELQVKKFTNDYGRILLENMISKIFGDGYYGSKVEDIDEATGTNVQYSCMVRKDPRPLKTIFGEIEIIRGYYKSDHGKYLGLLDRTLQIHKHVVSPGVRYYANVVGITTSFREGVDTFTKFLGIKISDKDVDNFTQLKSSEVFQHFADRVKDIELGMNETIQPAKINCNNTHERIVYLESDGCHVPLRHRQGGRECQECKTVLLFEVDKIEVEKNGKVEIQNKLKNKRYFSSIGKIEYFKKQVKCELEEYCKDENVKIVCIGDGAKWIWRMVKELIPEGRVEILDWYHVSEKITLLVSSLYPDEQQANDKELFSDGVLNCVYTQDIDKAIILLEEQYTTTKNRELQGTISEVIGYYQNNRERMKYKDYVEARYCIGSGAIESANKYAIQRRMKIPGCRWIESNADNVAHMRAEYINGNYDQWYGLETNPMLGAVT